jgi:hypothetical protein
MKTTHTPGPWKIQKFTGYRRVSIVARNPSPYSIDSVHVVSDVEPENAPCISAAPELLEALEACIAAFEEWEREDGDGAETPEYIIKARAAIAKATP